MHRIALTVNSRKYELEVSSNETLANVLRERLRLTGTKLGCEGGTCGACAVIIDGTLRNSCLTLAALCDKASVTTIEGLKNGDTLHAVQKAFLENGAIQCGYCTPGMVMAAVYLLQENPTPTEQEIREAISGNLCRCTGYTKIIEAVKNCC